MTAAIASGSRRRQAPVCSIVINNYNYGRFLRAAIDSALDQTCSDVEVVVVDDGSTDDSPDIIRSYAGRIRPVLKSNGGQASAINAGLASSRGEVVILLDADDLLLPTAVEQALPLFAEEDVVKVHWPLWTIGADGERTGRMRPALPLPEGDLRALVISNGPSSSGSPATSGNAWRRRFLEQVCPIPSHYRLCADDYLCALAPASGTIRRIADPQACYRLHGDNNYQEKSFEDKVRFGAVVQLEQCEVLARLLRRQGVDVDPGAWTSRLWFHKVAGALSAIDASIPAEASFILVDDDEWGAGRRVADRPRHYFVEHEGQYWGPPSDDRTAVAELCRLRRLGAEFIVFTWTAFWWLDCYAALRRELESTGRVVLQTERIVTYDLRAQGDPS